MRALVLSGRPRPDGSVEPFDGVVFAGREAMVMAGQVAIGLQEPRANDGTEFSPTRTGLDHSEIRPVAFGSIVEFRDPDGVQLEMFARS